MSDSEVPGKIEQFRSLGISALGFMVVRYFGKDWDTAGAFWMAQIIAAADVFQFSVKTYFWTRYLTAIDQPKAANVPNLNEPVKTLTLKPVINSYPNVTVAPRFDMERQFAKTLLVMHTYKPDDEAVDLRETYWIKPNKFRSRDEYLVVRGKWEYHDIIQKAAARRNAPYVVRDWNKVQAVADGTRLPPPPSRQ